MASGRYSFIDIAVLEKVRSRFAAGEALILLSIDLDEVIWANGAGAALFGRRDVETMMGASPDLGFVAKRQIAAVPGFPRMERDRSVMVRLARGVTSQAVRFDIGAVTLPDGTPAVLLAATPAHPGASGASVVAGFEEAGYFAAFLDGSGSVLAASEGFSRLEISAPTLAGLVAETAQESDRLVKRLIPAGRAVIPAGIARLTDEPARFLLIGVDEPVEEAVPVTGASREIVPDETTAEETVSEAQPAVVESSVSGIPAPSDADLPERIAEVGEFPSSDRAASAAEKAASVPSHLAGGETDDWYFGATRDPGQRERGEEIARPQPARAASNLASGPVRFVWRTDARGAFSTISPEFAAAVGSDAADVIGRPFREAAGRLGLDPDGEIASLLDRRDTWSGRTVSWPVAGTDLAAPVDLAALPVYNRDRVFEGFRGFGVVRMDDAAPDPKARGLRLGGVEDAQEAPAATEAAADNAVQDGQKGNDTDPFRNEVPVISITERLNRRISDKIIRLAEHRPPQPAQAAPERRLSPGERTAFEEIRERLRRETSVPVEGAPATAAELPGQSKPEALAEGSEAGDGFSLLPDAGAGEDTEIAAEAEAEAVSLKASEPDAADEAGQDHAEPDLETEQEPENEPDDRASAEAAQPSRLVAEDVADEAEPAAVVEARDVAAEAEAEAVSLRTSEPDAADAAGQDHAEPDLEDEQEPESEPDDRVGTEATEPARLAAEDVADEAEPATVVEAADEAGLPIGMAGEAEIAAGEDDPEQQAGAGEELEIDAPEADPSVFAGNERRPAVDRELISGLPLPLLVHAGDELYFANREFLDLTGYASLDQIRKDGGLDRLFVDDEQSSQTAGERKLRLRTLGGEVFAVDAHLQSIGWETGTALLLALKRAEPAPQQAGELAQGPTAEAVAAAASAASVPGSTGTQELERHLAELRTIIDTATDGVVLIAPDGTIRNISRPAEALFGFDSAAVEGKPFATLFAIESQKSARDYLAGLADNGVASVLNDGREVIGREAEGRFIPLFMTIGRLPEESGYCAVVRDITQFKRAEEELTQARAQAERASSQKTDFLARISHEIRTPLNAIIGFSELMMDEKFGPIGSDRYRDYLRDINRSGNHVLDLVNDLLDISKIEAGEQEMNYEAVSLNEALSEAVAMMQPQANRERVIIRSSLASRLPDVVADLRSVRQIALNLLSNAIRYTQAGGQVIVSTAYETSGDVTMRVRDTGIGMTLAEIDQALKPFKQINALKRGRHDGTGLGLPLTKAMVEANRARFAISSTPGEGTLVEIAFPSTRVLAE